MCFIWKSEQRAIIFVHITLFDSTIQMVCIYCAVRTRYLNIIEGNTSLQRTACHGSSDYSPPSHRGEPSWSRVSQCEMCVGHSGNGADFIFLRVLQFSPVSIIPPLLHTHSLIYHPRCIMFFSQYSDTSANE